MFTRTSRTRRLSVLAVGTALLITPAVLADASAATPEPTPTSPSGAASSAGAAPSASSAAPVSATPTTSSASSSAAASAPAPSSTAPSSAPATTNRATSSVTPSPAVSAAAATALLTAPSTVPVCQPLVLGGTTTPSTRVVVDLQRGAAWSLAVASATSDSSGAWHAEVALDECYLGSATYRARSGARTSASATVNRTGTRPTYTLAAGQSSHAGSGVFRHWGSVVVTGTVSVPTTTDVWVWGMATDRRSATRLGHATTGRDGSYRITIPQPASSVGSLFVDSGRGAGAQRSAEVGVGGQASVSLRTAATLDAMATGYVEGNLSPVNSSNRRIIVQVYRNGRWTQVVQGAVTGGRYRLPYTSWQFKDMPGQYKVRVAVTQPDGTLLWGRTNLVNRTANLRPVVRATTSADVAKTYRAGCPVGPSRLRTIEMNYLGYDRKMHRGVLVVRRDLSSRVVTAFTRGLAGGFPLKSLNNPNMYGGDDVVMMKAGNTSAFNCRHVTGNPYAMSPHSYGKAIDVNTIENPYRDPQGRWYPSTKYSSYRPSSVTGLLKSTSSLTIGLRGQGYSWFSGWDWQHFEAK